MPNLIKSHTRHTYHSIAQMQKCSGQPEMIVIGISNIPKALIVKTQQDHNHILKSDQNVQVDMRTWLLDSCCRRNTPGYGG